MASPILFQSDDASVIIIDIPQSIASAQGTPEHPWERTIYSSEPLTKPFPSNQPNSARALARASSNTTAAEVRLRKEYRDLVTAALEKVSTSHKGDYCLPRKHASVESSQPTKKRRLEEASAGDSSAFHGTDDPGSVVGQTYHQPPNNVLHALATKDKSSDNHQIHLQSTDPTAPNPETSFKPHDFITNPSHYPATLKITPNPPPMTHAYTYTLPPHCSAYLGDCTHPLPFHRTLHIHHLSQISQRPNESNPRSNFYDLILLDPPWPSRSTKRTHKNPSNPNNYATIANITQSKNLLLGLGLQHLLSPDPGAVVGVWVTNKFATREVVVEELFPVLGLEVVEEWLWVKVMKGGGLVAPVGDWGWKLPWEVLVLGRRRGDGEVGQDGVEGCVKRRVLVAVPDLHSRKPCLKGLMEGMVRDGNGDGLAKEEVRVLEVFARYAVAGWTAWGNECMKYNWDGCWTGPEETAEA